MKPDSDTIAALIMLAIIICFVLLLPPLTPMFTGTP